MPTLCLEDHRRGVFRVLSAGSAVAIKPSWTRSLGFTKGRIIGPISPLESVISDGGYYLIERLDGAADLRDLTPELHRSTFTPR
jgi:hypothetical protein